MKKLMMLGFVTLCIYGCKKENTAKPPVIAPFTFVKATISDSVYSNGMHNVAVNPVIKISFSGPVNTATVAAGLSLTGAGAVVSCNYTYSNNDTTIIIQPAVALSGLTSYTLSISSGLKSMADSFLQNNYYLYFITAIDTTDKFARISDSALLTLVEQQTFRYFWNFGHPVCGLARERTSSGDVVTTGGSGFGIMSMLVGVQRNFITRAAALSRIDTIVNFLTNKVTTYHGAFSHWINGTTAATVPFGTQDNGGDIVETSYMMQGLLCARQFFNSTTDSNEIQLRAQINTLYNNVDWTWYQQNGASVLTWNWSPNYGFAINVQVRGWCEAMITYIMAASSSTHSITNLTYTNGWAQNGAMKNGQSYYGINLPLGPSYGGPLFFAHYSFLGIDPNGLSDAYANYWTQNTAHAQINYAYCVSNPHNNYGYSSNCWGLTASDIPSGYTASSPTNDVGVIAPTAAISSLPYTPIQSMNALRYFYYTLGNKTWGQYGFVDAFNLNTIWFDSDCLAIDQGPEIVMIENYRSGLLWNLFMSCPEVKQGMKNLGFQSPHF